MTKSLWLCVSVVSLLAGCAPSPAARPAADAGQPTAASQSRTLVMAARYEPRALTLQALLPVAGAGDNDVLRLFNAGLTMFDDREISRPYLAESPPQLNTDSWRVFADGRMETTYLLRPNLTWHDGTPLSAEDFVFAWRVYATPDLGIASARPTGQVEELSAPDARTVVIHWKGSFPDASVLDARDLTPLPRHTLEAAFQRDPSEAFANLPFWTIEYVGLGPYRLERWEPGAFLEAAVFEGHALGKAKIDRIQVKVIPDSNAVLANLLSGDAHFNFTNAIFVQQGVVLKREWGTTNAGMVLVIPTQWRRVDLQQRPDYANPRAMLDVRVRRALAHAIDRRALNDAVFEGEGILTDVPVASSVEYGADVDRAITKYPYDMRRIEQLMAEAGFSRGADGVYLSPVDGRFATEIKENATADFAAELSIMASGLRQAGFDMREIQVPVSAARDGEVRATFPAMYVGGGGIGERGVLPNYVSTQIGRADNRWAGSNRGGWSNPDYDRLYAAFTTTLDRAERNRSVVEMMRVFTEQVGAISLYFNPIVVAHVAALHGPRTYAPEAFSTWNIHEWEWRS